MFQEHRRDRRHGACRHRHGLKCVQVGGDLAAWIGPVPKRNSSGGKERLGDISKQGDRYLRHLLVAGATSVVLHARRHPEKHPWIAKLLVRKPAKVVAVAFAVDAASR